MDLRITLRTESERKTAPGFAGAMGSTIPSGVREAEIALSDIPDDFDLDFGIVAAAAAPLTQMVDGIPEGFIEVEDMLTHEDETGEGI